MHLWPSLSLPLSVTRCRSAIGKLLAGLLLLTCSTNQRSLSAQTLTQSTLPIVKIATAGLTIPDEPRIWVNLQIVWHGPGQINLANEAGNHYNGVIAIEKRGSSSQDIFPKKSYAIETIGVDGANNNVPLFGMPAENDWVLYGPYSDKTLLRNVLAYHLARTSGHYAPRTQMVELLLNDQYQGVYVWMEKIKQDPGRVDIAKLTAQDTAGTELTGGYIIKVDKLTGNSGFGWIGKYWPLPNFQRSVRYQYHDPEERELRPVQRQYIRQYVDDFEDAIVVNSFADLQEGYRAYIDPVSFADYQLHTELARNVDGYRLSSFLYKDKGGKLKTGPVWDHNLSFGNADYGNGWQTTGWQYKLSYTNPDHCCIPYFWQRIQQDPYYQDLLQCRWQTLRQGPWHRDSIFAFLDSMVNVLDQGARQRNFQRWPILNQYVWPNPFIGQNYPQEILHLKSWITQRLTWMDQNLPGTCSLPLSIRGDTHSLPLRVGPLPWQESLTIAGDIPETGNLILCLSNLQGRKLANANWAVHAGQALQRNWTPPTILPPGIYLLRWQLNDLQASLKLYKP